MDDTVALVTAAEMLGTVTAPGVSAFVIVNCDVDVIDATVKTPLYCDGDTLAIVTDAPFCSPCVPCVLTVHVPAPVEIVVICALKSSQNEFVDEPICAGCTAKESCSAVDGVAVPVPAPGLPGLVAVATAKLFGASVSVGARVAAVTVKDCSAVPVIAVPKTKAVVETDTLVMPMGRTHAFVAVVVAHVQQPVADAPVHVVPQLVATWEKRNVVAAVGQAYTMLWTSAVAVVIEPQLLIAPNWSAVVPAWKAIGIPLPQSDTPVVVRDGLVLAVTWTGIPTPRT